MRLLKKKAYAGLIPVMSTILEFIMFATVMLFCVGYISQIRDNTTYAKQYLSRDIAYLIDTMYALPGNVLFVYRYPNVDMSKLAISLSDNFVQVQESQGNDQKTSFTYASRGQAKFSTATITYQPIYFAKSGDMFDLTQLNMNMLQCGERRFVSPKSIFFDIRGNPANSTNLGTLLQSKINSIIVSEVTLKLGTSFHLQFSRQVAQLGSIADDAPRRDSGEIAGLASQSDAAIAVDVGGDQHKSISYIKVYYLLNSTAVNDSSYLACKIADSILYSLPEIDAASIVPVSPDFYDKKVSDLLYVNKLSVYIEIGNSQNKNYALLLNDENKLKKIGDGIALALS